MLNHPLETPDRTLKISHPLRKNNICQDLRSICSMILHNDTSPHFRPPSTLLKNKTLLLIWEIEELFSPRIRMFQPKMFVNKNLKIHWSRLGSETIRWMNIMDGLTESFRLIQKSWWHMRRSKRRRSQECHNYHNSLRQIKSNKSQKRLQCPELNLQEAFTKTMANFNQHLPKTQPGTNIL